MAYEINPYIYVQKAVGRGDSLLSLCCGIGREFQDVNAGIIVGVDIVPEYLGRVRHTYPDVVTVLADARSYIKDQESKSFDVISCLDGVEHMKKADGLKVLKECIRVARKKVLVFTPEGYVRNEPVETWGVPGGDEYQKHLSGWSVEDFEKLGYILLERKPAVSHHGEDYHALMFEYNV